MKTTAILAKVKVVSIEDTGKSFGENLKASLTPGKEPVKPETSPSDKTGEKVKLEAVEGVSDENGTYTTGDKPEGTITLNITNREAFGYFKKDAEYTVRILPVVQP